MTITKGTPQTRAELAAVFAELDPLNQCIDITTDLAAYTYFNDSANTHQARAVPVTGSTVGTVSGSANIVQESISGVTLTYARLNDSHFIIGWANFGFSPDTTNIKVQVATVAPTVVTPGAKQTLATNSGLLTGPHETAIARVSDNTGVMFFGRDDTFDLVAIAFIVIGNTIDSFGSPVTILAADAVNFMSAHTLWDDQHVVLGYRDGDNVSAQIISVVGTVVTFGARTHFQGEGSNQATRVVGMTPTRGALFSNRIVGAVSLLSWGRQFSVSGLVITPTGLTVDYGGTLDRDFNRGAVRLTDEVGMLNYIEEAGVQEVVTEFTVNDAGSISINQIPFSLIAPAPADSNMGVSLLGDSRALIMYDTDQLAVISTDFISPIVESQLWLTIDGGLIHTKISDPAWTLPVEAVAVMPGTTYNEIWAAVGTEIYKTLNAGDTWVLLATLTFIPSAAVLMFDNSVVFYTKQTGGNRVSFVDTLGVVSNLDIGHTVSGVGSAMKAAA